ncbi:MAG: DNA-binding protein [Planctomycetes bacterium]|jgi:nucleoid DNA-binding protein|nr:DNA-binding protein [Planctomycetota bacterium]
MAKAKAAGKKAAKKAMTKSQFVAHLADKSGLTKKQVDGLLAEVVSTVTDQLKAAGKFVFPGLARITRTYKEAKKGGEVKKNPLNGKEYTTKDKPAHYRVRINPIKAIKTALA